MPVTTLVTFFIVACFKFLAISHFRSSMLKRLSTNHLQLIEYFRSAMIKATKQWKLKLQPRNVAETGQIKKRKSFSCSLLSSGTIYAGGPWDGSKSHWRRFCHVCVTLRWLKIAFHLWIFQVDEFSVIFSSRFSLDLCTNHLHLLPMHVTCYQMAFV